MKKRDGYVDLTLLQKKGILKKEEEKKDFVSIPQTTEVQTFTQQTNTTSENPFSFLDNLANSSQTNIEQNISKPAEDFSSLTVKLENLEYQLERFLERLDKIEEKLREFKESN